MTPSVPNISSKALRNFRLYYFVRCWGKEVIYITYYSCFLHGQRMTIREILEDNGVSFGRKSPFNGQEIVNLTDKPPHALDITLLNKICQALWQKGYNDPGAEIKNLITRIKDERNFVSHEDVDISSAELEMKLHDLKLILEEALDKVKSKFPHYGTKIDNLKSNIKATVPKLLGKIRERYDPSVAEDLENLKEEIDEFRVVLSDYVQKLCRKELLSLYVHLCKVLPFDWLPQYEVVEPCEFMVYLRMDQEEEFHRGHCGSTSVTIDQNEILEIKDPLGRDSKVVIISGDAGSGKTTILCSIIEKWHKDSNDMPNLSSFQIVLYMQFRNHSFENFDDYLKSLLPKTISFFDLKHIKSSIIESKCLVLCDGFDEANKNSEKLFEEILSLNSNSNGMKIVVTTRPGNTEKLTKIVNKSKFHRINLKVLGLQKQDMSLLIEKLTGHLVKDDEHQRNKMVRELLDQLDRMNINTMAILKTPLYFNLYILLFIECPNDRNKINTMMSLFLQLKKHRMRRVIDKTMISTKAMEEFDALYKKWSQYCYMNNIYEWPETVVNRFKSEIKCHEIHENFEAIMSSYFSIKHTRNDMIIEIVYCYKHKSEQEFEAASIVCDEITKSDERKNKNFLLNILKSNGILRARELIIFITGILYETERNVLYDIMVEIHKLYFINCEETVNFDYILALWAETRLDSKVLNSLVSILKESYVKETMGVDKISSIYALPSLVSALMPKKIQFSELPRDLSVLNETLQITNHHKICTEFWLNLSLKYIPQCTGQLLHPVDLVDIVITEYGFEDKEKLSTIPLVSTAKNMKIHYMTWSRDVDCVARILDKITPSNLAKDTTHLWLHFDGPFLHRITETDIRRMLEQITARSLRSINISTKWIADRASPALRQFCSQKGFGDLNIFDSKPRTTNRLQLLYPVSAVVRMGSVHHYQPASMVVGGQQNLMARHLRPYRPMQWHYEAVREVADSVCKLS